MRAFLGAASKLRDQAISGSYPTFFLWKPPTLGTEIADGGNGNRLRVDCTHPSRPTRPDHEASHSDGDQGNKYQLDGTKPSHDGPQRQDGWQQPLERRETTTRRHPVWRVRHNWLPKRQVLCVLWNTAPPSLHPVRSGCGPPNRVLLHRMRCRTRPNGKRRNVAGLQ